MRARREDWSNLHPDDVAWVTEWQLAAAFRWVPIGEESPIRPDPCPDPGGRVWYVTLTLGSAARRVPLPVRELAGVIRWCHSCAAPCELRRPPARVRAGLAAVREALRGVLAGLDPLREMGCAAPAREPGGATGTDGNGGDR